MGFLGFRGLGFRGLGFRGWGLGVRVYRVQGSRGLGFGGVVTVSNYPYLEQRVQSSGLLECGVRGVVEGQDRGTPSSRSAEGPYCV